MARGKDMKGRNTSSKTSSSLPGYIWLFAGLAIGLFISFLVYLSQQPAEKDSLPQTISKELDKHKNKNKKAETDAEKTSAATAADTKPAREPKFDFYTILSESETFVPEPGNRKTETKPSTKSSNQTTVSGTQYLLQAGSFRNHADADNLKANLALLGVTSSIQSVTVNNESWHRVRIGPFKDDKKLRDTLATLKGNNIHAMTMELK
jgi:cell division protein FtsN